MSNQLNYVQILSPPLSDRYLISRIVESPLNEILQETVPIEFGFYPAERLELVLYSPLDGQLVSSQIIPLSDNIITVHAVVYEGGASQNFLAIDFSRVNDLYPSFLIPGVYDMVINIFEDMIGDDQDKKMIIDEISTTRTEIKLRFPGIVGATEITELQNITVKSIPKPFAGGIADLILVPSDATTDGVSIEDVLARLDAFSNRIVDNLNLTANFKETIKLILEDARDGVIETMAKSSIYRFTEEDYRNIVVPQIVLSFNKYQTSFSSNVEVI
jgi:hypothetical protein